MAEFTPITTQEQFDAAIADRLKRERESQTKKYGDYDALKQKTAEQEQQIAALTKEASDAAKKYAGYDKTVAELNAKIKGYETDSVKTRIARETGIPYELAGRLTGETEDDIRKDAEGLAKLLGRNENPASPLRDTETGEPDGVTAGLKELLHKMKGD